MAVRKRKAVISAEAGDLDAVEALVRQGQYRTVSEFVREAVSEKLARHWRERLGEQVDRYCTAGTDGADDELLEWQAIAATDRTEARKPSRAKR
ncbi:MAG: ribbon-helix-helix protein, CopG family [bacterium]|nr:ribbon-helix-helix protein, CopG family [bacterium]